MKANENKEANLMWADTLLSRAVRMVKEYRYAVASCLIFGFLSYMFVFTNKLVNWDELTAIFGKGATIESGRWGLELLSYIIPNYSMPWLYGCMTLACMTISMCIVCHIFQIKSPMVQIVLSGLVIVFPSLTGTFAYMFTSSCYGVAFLLSMLAFYFLQKGGWKRNIAGVVLAVLSTGIYQSYVMVLSSFLIVLLIQKVMYTDASAKQVFLQGIRFVGLLALAMGLYFAVARAFNYFTSIPMCGYAENSMNHTDSIFVRIKSMYVSFYNVIFNNQNGLVSGGIVKYIHIAAAGLVLAEIICWIAKKRFVLKSILLVFLVGILPISIFGMYLTTKVNSVHTLVLYSFIAVYLLAAVLIDGRNWNQNAGRIWNRCRAVICNGLIVGMLVVIYSNTLLANEAYLKLHLTHQNTISFGSSLVAELNAQPEYSGDIPIAFLGKYNPPAFYEKFQNINIMGIPTLSPDWHTLYYYCGYHFPVASSEEIARVQSTPEVQNMPCYPDHGYVQIVDGVAVVKFSN